MLIIIIYCSRTLRYERTQISNQISETEPRDKNGTSHLRVVFEKTGCEMGEPEAPAPRGAADVYFLLVAASNLVTALVPSETACLASSPGRMRRTAVWTSREPRVFVLLKRQTFAASLPMRSKRS